jgi:FAD synthetase
LKDALKAVWLCELKFGVASLNCLKKELKDQDIVTVTNSLLKKDLIKSIKNGYKLTEEGRKKIKIVLCGGVFDILHPGHGFILEKAKELGDLLVVVVARDSTVKRRKRIPVVPESQRVEMINFLKPVDIALLGREGHFLKIIEDIMPDIITLGPDQKHSEGRIKKELIEKGLDVEVRRIEEYRACPLHSTKDILQKIIEVDYPNSRNDD